MRRSLLLLLLTLALVAVPATALPDPGPQDAPREDAERANRRLLERWRADPDHAARLQRDLKAFWALPPERRARLRQLDQELHQQDSATQKRLWSVLEGYHAWLERLPGDERRRLASASDWRERLRLVRELREREWVRRQPAPVRKRLESLAPPERSREVAALRHRQRQRYEQAPQPAARPGGYDRP